MYLNDFLNYGTLKDIILFTYAIFSFIFFLGRFSKHMSNLLITHLKILHSINENLTGINENLKNITVNHENHRTEHSRRVG